MEIKLNSICPTKKLSEQLSNLVEREDRSRISKFFKRHKNEIKENLESNGSTLTVTEVKNQVLESIE